MNTNKNNKLFLVTLATVIACLGLLAPLSPALATTPIPLNVASDVEFTAKYTITVQPTTGQMAIKDPAGKIVSAWFTITPTNSSIFVKNGEVVVIYHLLGGKVRDLPLFWNFRQSGKTQFSGDLDRPK